MLNLLRVELGKLFTGKVFRITILAYIITILSVFIPVSYTESISGALSPIASLSGEAASAIDAAAQELEQADELLASIREGDNFIQAFYTASSGQSAVVMIFVTIFIFADFLNGTLQNTLLCGYSRTRVYLAKLLCGFMGGCLFYALNMLLLIILGVGFYHMRLSGEVMYYAVQVLLSQCIALSEYVAVFTAFAFCFGNGWAFLGSTLFFILLPSIPLVLAMAGSRDHTMAAAFLPSFVSVNGVGGFITLEQMVSMPQQWSAGLVVSALLVLAAVTGLSTIWGIWAFGRKQL